MKTGVIILCGGASSRMGRDKSTLPFGRESLLERVLRLVGEVVPPAATVCVAAGRQQRPQFAGEVRWVTDRVANCGPLQALATGLGELEPTVAAAYVTSCDVPLLQPAFLRQMFAMLEDYQVAVPCDDRFRHPLAAVYRPSVRPVADELLAEGRHRLLDLLDRCHTRNVPVDRLRDADPHLHSLLNCNRPADYAQALRIANL